MEIRVQGVEGFGFVVQDLKNLGLRAQDVGCRESRVEGAGI